MSSLQHEEALIEELNEVMADWRDHYETLEEAANELLEGYFAEYSDNDESELDFDEDWIT